MLEGTGIDSGSGILSQVQSDNAIIVQDKAGNITQLDVSLFKISNKRAGMEEMNLNSLMYNNLTISLPKTTLKLEWSSNLFNTLNHLVQNFDIFNQIRILAVYVPKDRSTVIENTIGQNSEKTTSLGLKIIKLTTDKGKLELEVN